MLALFWSVLGFLLCLFPSNPFGYVEDTRAGTTLVCAFEDYSTVWLARSLSDGDPCYDPQATLLWLTFDNGAWEDCLDSLGEDVDIRFPECDTIGEASPMMTIGYGPW